MWARTSGLSPAQKESSVKAVLALKNNVDSVLHPGQQKRYDDFVEVHKNVITGPAMFEPLPHGTSLFFPVASDPATAVLNFLFSSVNDRSIVDREVSIFRRVEGGPVVSEPPSFWTAKTQPFEQELEVGRLEKPRLLRLDLISLPSAGRTKAIRDDGTGCFFRC